MSELSIHAYAFLVAGGKLTFDDWISKLDDEEREAFMIAGRQVSEEKAKLVATAVAEALREQH